MRWYRSLDPHGVQRSGRWLLHQWQFFEWPVTRGWSTFKLVTWQLKTSTWCTVPGYRPSISPAELQRRKRLCPGRLQYWSSGLRTCKKRSIPIRNESGLFHSMWLFTPLRRRRVQEILQLPVCVPKSFFGLLNRSKGICLYECVCV